MHNVLLDLSHRSHIIPTHRDDRHSCSRRGFTPTVERSSFFVFVFFSHKKGSVMYDVEIEKHVGHFAQKTCMTVSLDCIN